MRHMYLKFISMKRNSLVNKAIFLTFVIEKIKSSAVIKANRICKIFQSAIKIVIHFLCFSKITDILYSDTLYIHTT